MFCAKILELTLNICLNKHPPPLKTLRWAFAINIGPLVRKEKSMSNCEKTEVCCFVHILIIIFITIFFPLIYSLTISLPLFLEKLHFHVSVTHLKMCTLKIANQPLPWKYSKFHFAIILEKVPYTEKFNYKFFTGTAGRMLKPGDIIAIRASSKSFLVWGVYYLKLQVICYEKPFKHTRCFNSTLVTTAKHITVSLFIYLLLYSTNAEGL